MGDDSKLYTAKSTADKAFARFLAERYSNVGYYDVFHGMDAAKRRTGADLLIDGAALQVTFFDRYRKYEYLPLEVDRLARDRSRYLLSGILAPGTWQYYLIGDTSKHWIFARPVLENLARRYQANSWIAPSRDERSHVVSISLARADQLQSQTDDEWVLTNLTWVP